VGDEDHRYTLIAQPAEEVEQCGYFGRGKHRRWLVEQEHASAAQEHLDDFHALPLAQGEMANLGSR
jgi:hypothetical protein